jgi:hypothetical protein
MPSHAGAQWQNFSLDSFTVAGAVSELSAFLERRTDFPFHPFGEKPSGHLSETQATLGPCPCQGRWARRCLSMGWSSAADLLQQMAHACRAVEYAQSMTGDDVGFDGE